MGAIYTTRFSHFSLCRFGDIRDHGGNREGSFLGLLMAGTAAERCSPIRHVVLVVRFDGSSLCAFKISLLFKGVASILAYFVKKRFSISNAIFRY